MHLKPNLLISNFIELDDSKGIEWKNSSVSTTDVLYINNNSPVATVGAPSVAFSVLDKQRTISNTPSFAKI